MFARRWFQSVFRLICAAAVIPLAAPGICSAQTLFDEGRSLEFRTDVDWTRMQLEGREEIDGVSPLRVPGPLAGEYWLSAWGPGVELQRGRVAVDLDGSGSGIRSYGRRGLAETALYSMLYPGVVQYGQGQEGKGLYLGSLAAAGIIGTIVTEVLVWEADNDLERANRAYFGASAAERGELGKARIERQEDRDRATDRRNIMAIGTAAVWGVSLLDGVLFSPGFRVRTASEDGLTLSMSRQTAVKAVAHSLLFPGLGQEYNGEPVKAAWIAGGAVAAGLWLMYRQDEYAEDVHEYDKAHRRFLAASSVAEAEEYSRLRDDRYSAVKDSKRDRNIAIGILGAYWGVAALETMLSFGNSWGDSEVRRTDVGLAVDPMEGSVAAQWKF